MISICIATYNRARYLEETLKNIIPQVTDEVEIVIVDGASTDGTGSMVKGYIEVCKQIHYIRLLSKGGVDQDFCKAVELAKGDYCWLMSDDDILKQGAIQAVLEEIKRCNYDLIIVNSEVRNSDLSILIEKKLLWINENKIYTPAENEKFFVENAMYMSFIGCVVINKSLWDKREKERYIGSAFIHVGVIFQSAISSNTLVIAEPYIIIRYGNAEWAPRAFEIWMFKWPNIIWSFPNFSDRTKSQITPKEPYLQYSNLWKYRARGSYSINEYRKFIEPRLKSKWKRFMSKMIAGLPGYLVNFTALLYYTYNYNKWEPILIRNSRFYWKRLGAIFTDDNIKTRRCRMQSN